MVKRLKKMHHWVDERQLVPWNSSLGSHLPSTSSSLASFLSSVSSTVDLSRTASRRSRARCRNRSVCVENSLRRKFIIIDYDNAAGFFPR
tara:strand:- start:464 stop:733 length:270 start_codon:yes stop_codon:yes gene_type:complete